MPARINMPDKRRQIEGLRDVHTTAVHTYQVLKKETTIFCCLFPHMGKSRQQQGGRLHHYEGEDYSQHEEHGDINYINQS